MFKRWHPSLSAIVRRGLRPLFGASAVAVLAVVATLSIPVLLGYLVAQLQASAADVKITLPVVLGMLLVSLALHAFANEWSARISDRLNAEFRLLQYRHALEAEMSVHRARSPAKLLAAMAMDTYRASQLFTGVLPSLVTTAAFLLGATAGLFHYYPSAAPGALLLITAAGLLLWRASRRFHTTARQLLDQHALAHSLVESSLLQIGTVKAYGLGDFFRSRYRGLQQAIVSGSRRERMQRLWLASMTQIAGILLFGIAAWLLYRQVRAQSVRLETMLPAAVFALLLLRQLGQLANLIGQGRQGVAAADRLSDFLNQPKETDTGDAAAPARPLRRIEVQRLNFGYRPGNPVLQDINLTIRHGEKIALTGPNGAGKTTLINLMLGMDRIAPGMLFWNDQDWSRLDRRLLREHITLVPQNPLLGNRSILENIRYGNLGAEQDAVMECARKAGVDAMVRSLPDGYDTLAGAQGLKLSGGQIQRIILARALLRPSSQLVLFDEPTRMLDDTAQAEFLRMLEQEYAEKTVIVVTHSDKVIKHLNRLLRLEAGRLVQDEVIGD